MRVILQVWNFNSIKVQLKPAIKKQQQAQEAFQFHKGTIKTSSSGTARPPSSPISIP